MITKMTIVVGLVRAEILDCLRRMAVILTHLTKTTTGVRILTHLTKTTTAVRVQDLVIMMMMKVMALPE